MDIYELIARYYEHRHLIWPGNADTALDWALTEMAEAKELLLARQARWVRNHPQNEEPFSRERLAEELGDILMMVMVAGMVEGLDPIQALREKIERKMRD